MEMKLLIGVCAISISGVVYAECPNSLSTEKLVECVTIEGAGENYQDWLAEFNKVDSNDLIASNVSPITGEDIRSVKPAAGKPK